MNRPSMAALLVVTATACAEVVTPEPIGDYTTWKRLEVEGPAPGHGDTYRIIFANPIAADPTQDFYEGYADGAVIVKEIRNLEGGGPGTLRYLAIMRRDRADDRLDDEGGWLFTRADKLGATETHADFCWGRCHVAAPYLGAWYDYRR